MKMTAQMKVYQVYQTKNGNTEYLKVYDPRGATWSVWTGYKSDAQLFTAEKANQIYRKFRNGLDRGAYMPFGFCHQNQF